MMCRLCCEECLDFKNLFEKDDRENYIYKICQKFFLRELEMLSRTLVGRSKIICSICWKTINEFNDFYEKIVAKQRDYWDMIAARQSLVLPEVDDNFTIKDLDEGESEFSVRNEFLRKSPVERSKSCLEDDSQNTDSFAMETTVPKDSADFDSVIIHSLNGSVDIQSAKEFMRICENELSRDDDTSQSLANSCLGEQIQESIGNGNDFQNTDTFSIETTIPEDSVGYDSVMSNSSFKDSVEMEDQGDIILISESDSGEDDDPSQSHSNSYLATPVASQDQEKESNRSRLDELKKKRILEIESKILNKTWKIIFRCDLCKYSTDGYADFIRHYVSAHKENFNSQKFKKPFECEICHEWFTLSSELKRHFLAHLESLGKYKCPECDERFAAVKCLNIHRKNSHSKIKHTWKCDVCGKELSTRTILIFHKNGQACKARYQKQEKLLKSQNELIVSSSELVDKANGTIDEIKDGQWSLSLRCDLCDYSSDSYVMLISHYKQAHVDDLIALEFQKPLECEICHDSFDSKISLISHMYIHENPVSKCSHCGEGFDCKESLNRHIEENHTISNWRCDLCGVQLTTKYELDNHKAKNVCKVENVSTNDRLMEIRPEEASEKYGAHMSSEQYLQHHMEDLDCYESHEIQGRDVDDQYNYETLFEGVESDFILDG